MVRIQVPFNSIVGTQFLTCDQASPNGDNYFPSAAGGTGADFLSPTDSLGFRDRSWQDNENSEANTPYVSEMQ